MCGCGGQWCGRVCCPTFKNINIVINLTQGLKRDDDPHGSICMYLYTRTIMCVCLFMVKYVSFLCVCVCVFQC